LTLNQHSSAHRKKNVLTSNFNAYEKEISISIPRVPTGTSIRFLPFLPLIKLILIYEKML